MRKLTKAEYYFKLIISGAYVDTQASLTNRIKRWMKDGIEKEEMLKSL